MIGPLQRFTAIIGPNGSGKSNLMDAISFVLGVHSRQLRGTQLLDLVHKPPRSLHPEHQESTSDPIQARVSLIYAKQDEEQTYITFTREIDAQGHGRYQVNQTEVTFDQYTGTLKDLGILVKARNFLVFQGDVESIAAKTPAELTKLFEQISGSEELKTEYDQLLEEKNTAEENTIFAYQKKKGLAAEKKWFANKKKKPRGLSRKKTNCISCRSNLFCGNFIKWMRN